MEHRWGHRVPLDFPVQVFLNPGPKLIGRIRNVSVSGAFIGTTDRFALWVPLEIALLPPNGLPPALERVSAHVTRRTRDGIGIEWCELAPAPVRLLLADAPGDDASVPRFRPNRRASVEAQDGTAAPPRPRRSPDSFHGTLRGATGGDR